jgi:predicted nucleic acid-binding Zn ribbon protein
MPRKYLLNKICANCGKSFPTRNLHQKTCSKSCGTILSRRKKRMASELKICWACGGGVQSTAIAALIYTGKLPKPDYAWIVDTGWEKTSTMDYVNDILIPKLSEVGVTLHIIKSVDYSDNSIFDPAGCTRLPAYCQENNKIGKLRVRCSGTWKDRAAQRWLHSRGVKHCQTWIGISFDERRRCRNSRLKWYQFAYPLVNMLMLREDCIDYVARLGWPKPEHTACLICPNQTDYQWWTLKEKYPQDWQKAVETEQMIRVRDSNIYLHCSCVPLDGVRLDVL